MFVDNSDNFMAADSKPIKAFRASTTLRNLVDRRSTGRAHSSVPSQVPDSTAGPGLASSGVACLSYDYGVVFTFY